MGKLVIDRRRFLPLYALLLVFSSVMRLDIAFAQQLTVTINPTQGSPGTGVTATGNIGTNPAGVFIGQPGDLIQVPWDDTGGPILTQTIVRSDGTFSVPFSVPSNATEGAHPIWFLDRREGYLYVIGSSTFTVTIGQSQPPPGWYMNSGAGGKSSILYEDISLRIVWENSYIYQHPGTDNLYWYAQVVYLNKSNKGLMVSCSDQDKPSRVKEHMRNTANSGTVAAEETFCSRNPNFTGSLEPGGTHYSWAIFHNVPWRGSEVSLEWGLPYGVSGWVDPWHTPVSAPPPAECPPELVRLGTCQSKVPQGKAPNLIVLVHGCCTDAQDVYEWNALADTMVGEIIKDQRPTAWEIVVWDWTKCTPDPNVECTPKPPIWDIVKYLNQVNTAHTYAITEGKKLADAIEAAINKSSVNAYEYVHFIGHSAGAKLIHEASKKLAANKNLIKKPFIHLTFLDAYTSDDRDTNNYGTLADAPDQADYPDRYAEHYVDIGLWYTDAILPHAFNFNITDWEPVSHQFPDEKRDNGHQWPRYWYQKSVTTPGFRYGHPLSREGGGGIDRFKELATKWPASNPPQPCILRNETTENPPSCDFKSISSPTPTPTPPSP